MTRRRLAVWRRLLWMMERTCGCRTTLLWWRNDCGTAVIQRFFSI